MEFDKEISRYIYILAHNQNSLFPAYNSHKFRSINQTFNQNIIFQD